MKLKILHCDENKKTKILTKLKNSNCDKTQIEGGKNSITQNVTKLKLGQKSKTQIVTKIKNSKT